MLVRRVEILLTATGRIRPLATHNRRRHAVIFVVLAARPEVMRVVAVMLGAGRSVSSLRRITG
jgi:hypothetical protein